MLQANLVLKFEDDKGKPRPAILLHYFPHTKGYILVPFTDVSTRSADGEVWAAGTQLSHNYFLQKDSSVSVRYVEVRSDAWILARDPSIQGQALPGVIRRARQCLYRNIEDMQSEIAGLLEQNRAKWFEP